MPAVSIDGITMQQVKAVTAVVRKGGLTEAGKLLGVNQPTVSSHILNMEKHFGFPIFRRAGKSRRIAQAWRGGKSAGVQLTDKGQAVHSLCSSILDTVTLLEQLKED